MKSPVVRSMKTWVLRVLTASASICAGATCGSELISVSSVHRLGEFLHAPTLLIDGKMPPEGSAFDDPQCVHWGEPGAYLVLDLGTTVRVTGMTVQVDNDDEYVIEAGTDGQSWAPILVVSGEVGEVDYGMDTISTVEGEPERVTALAVAPVEARYLKLRARAGDQVYAASELLVYGERIQAQPGIRPPDTATTTPDASVPSTPVPTPIDPKKPLKAKSVRGIGEFSRAAKLLIDQKMPKQETAYDNRSCVYWSDPETCFMIDLGETLWIAGLTIQADNNDDYVIQVSLDGKIFKPLLTISSEWGEVNDGMDTLSTLVKDPQYVPQMTITPAQVRFVRLSAKRGDEAYSVSELLLYGSRTPPVVTPPASQQAVGTVQPPEGVPPVSGGVEGDMEGLFDTVDTNKDGRLSKEEYAAVWKDKLDVEKNFPFFDKDGNGYIEKAEFLSLRDGLTEETSRDRTEQPQETEQESAQLDPVRVRKAIDALSKWAQIKELMEAERPMEVDKIVKDLGFENWLVLNYYFNMIRTIGLSVEENPETKNVFVPTFGQEAVDLITKSETLARIKQYAPK